MENEKPDEFALNMAQARAQHEDFVFSLGATARLAALTGRKEVVIMSVTDGTFIVMDSTTDETFEEGLTRNEVMDLLDDAVTADLLGIFGDGSLTRERKDLHPVVQRLTA